MRARLFAASLLALSLVANATTTARAGGTGGGPTGGGGGISGGGGSGGGGVLAMGSCGSPTRVLAVYDNQYWNNVSSSTPYASAGQTALSPAKLDNLTFQQHVWPGYTTKDRSMVFLIDSTNGYAWGPSDLPGYSPVRGTPPGEGFPPHGAGAFDLSGSFTFQSGSPQTPTWWNAGWEDWSCFNGGPPIANDTPPINFNFAGLTHGGGDPTVTNIGPAGSALVFDAVTAKPLTPCPLYSDSPASGANYILSNLNITSDQYPVPSRTDYSTPPAGCPNAGVNHGTTTPTGTWKWYDYQYPVTSQTLFGGMATCSSGTNFSGSPSVSACPPGGLGFPAAQCASSTNGYLRWDWQPASFTSTPPARKCSNSATDSESFEHVHAMSITAGSPPGTACTAAGCGLNVTLSENWGAYECLGAITASSGDTWSWRLFTGQSMTYAYPDGFNFTYACTDPSDTPFVQTYTSSRPVAVDQIEAVAG